MPHTWPRFSCSYSPLDSSRHVVRKPKQLQREAHREENTGPAAACPAQGPHKPVVRVNHPEACPPVAR